MVVVLGSQYYKVSWLRNVIQISLSGMVMGKKMLSSVQSLSCVRLFATPWTAACQVSLSITNSRLLLKLMSIDMSRWCHPTISSSSIFSPLIIYTVILCLEALYLSLSKGFSSLPSCSFPWVFIIITVFKISIFLFKDFTQLFLFFAMPYGLWDLSSLTRDQTGVSCNGSAES